MDNPVLYLVGLGLLFLLALVFGILSAKTWRWPDVVAGFLVFLLSLTFLILLSLSLKTRRHWVQQVATQRAQLEKNETDNQMLLFGELTETGQTDTFTTLSARLSRFLLDRGRVWRDTVPAANADGTFNITIPGAGAENPHQIPQRFILYIFRETRLDNGIVVPANYIGEFEVTAVSDTGVQVRPSLLAPDILRAQEEFGAEFQQRFLNFYVSGPTWSLYETLPVDDHELFTPPDINPDLAQVGEPAFGPIDAQEVTTVFNLVAGLLAAPMSDQERAELVTPIIERYTRDGQRAQPTDPPQNVYTKVRFLKNYEVKVDADVIAGGTANVDFFDVQGQAQLDFLGVDEGDTVTMNEGDFTLLPIAAANQLINEQVCERIEDIYVRNLTDYTTMFRSSHDRILELRNKRFFIDRNLTLARETNESLTQLLQQSQQEKLRLEADVQKVSYENQQITALAGQAEAQLNTLKTNIRELLGNILALERQLENAQRYISENVARDVQQAATSP